MQRDSKLLKLHHYSSFRRMQESSVLNNMDSGMRRNDDIASNRCFLIDRHGQRGFTLVEMVMVILVVGLLTITLGKMLNTGVIAFDEGRKVIDTLSSLRLTTERLARELRTVRRNPAVPGDFDFLAKSATSVQFRRFENDGITVTTVTINAAPPNLTLAYDTPVGSYILTDQLGSLSLSYLRADDTITTSNTDVAFVVIDVSLTDSNGNNYPQRTRVALRNRQ